MTEAPITPDERKALRADMSERFRLMVEAMDTIRATGEAQGSIECPKCHGRLHFSVARSNGHIHGRCETRLCLRWMQ